MTREVPPWKYRCSACGELVKPGPAMTEHTEEHRAQPDWRGVLTWTRVDDEPSGRADQ